jgi:hypothetical protein
MANNKRAPIEAVSGTRGGKLKAPVIVVYPESLEERAKLASAAVNEDLSLTRFMLFCANKHIGRRTQKVA